MEEEPFRIAQKPRNLVARGSKVVVRDIQDPDTGIWRRDIRMSQNKFDDQAKEIFLAEFAKWGRMMESANKAGVSPQCVRQHMENDEEFAQAVHNAEMSYHDKLIGHHQDLVFNGQTKVTYDRQGNVVSEEKIYPIRLIELELKKHDAGYREKQEITHVQTGGVLVAPAEAKSVDDWEARFSKAKVINEIAEEEGPIDRLTEGD